MLIEHILIRLIRDIKPRSTGLARNMILSDCDIHQTDRLGNTALIEACKRHFNDIAELLIERGADIHHGNRGMYNDNALSWSVFVGNAEMVVILLNLGCDIQKRTAHKGNSLLMWAYRQGRPELFHMLLLRGADPALRTFEGTTVFDAVHLTIYNDMLNDWRRRMLRYVVKFMTQWKRDFEPALCGYIFEFLAPM